MDAEQQVLELVELIYEAASDPQSWQAVLERVAVARLGLRDAIAVTLHGAGANSSNISIFHSPRGEAFGEEECKLLRELAPHLQRAFQLHNRIQRLEWKRRTVGDVLDHLPWGVVLLDAKGHVLLVNGATTELLARERALKLSPYGLVAAMQSENTRLNALIRGAIATANDNGLHSVGAMTISRSGPGRSLQVLVTTLKTKTIHLGKDTPVVAIFISDPDREPVLDSDILAQLYGLTRAEARLAQIVASGGSLREAARQLGVAQSTVRSQLKSIFGKTNTNRQSELVRLLLMAPARSAT